MNNSVQPPNVPPDQQDSGHFPIAIRGLRKAFGSQVVLNGIDLTVDRGKTLSVLGRSGTGKSVLLKLIIGLLKPDSGSIEIDGQDIVKIPRERAE